MQIEPTFTRLVQLNFGLNGYFWTQWIAETFAEPKLWSKYLLRPKFRLSERLSQKVKLSNIIIFSSSSSISHILQVLNYTKVQLSLLPRSKQLKNFPLLLQQNTSRAEWQQIFLQNTFLSVFIYRVVQKNRYPVLFLR